MKACKKKSRLKKNGFFRKNIKKNYLAAWIANLGVVPLFLLAAFLLAPAFFFFLNLLFVVTHVLETIRQLLSTYRNQIRLNFNFKSSFLPTKHSCVKEILGTFCLFLLFNRAIKAETVSRNVILAKGQSIELNMYNIEKFNISNKQVISYKFNEKNKILNIRGQQIGHCEVLVWLKDQKSENFQIYVITKIQESKYLHLADIANHLGLESQLLFPHLRIWGKLKSLDQYLEYKKLLHSNNEQVVDEVEIDTDLKSKIVGHVYASFFEDFKDSIKCSSQFSDIICEFPENDAPSDSLKKNLTDKYKIQWVQQSQQRNKKNYFLKIKLIQIEQLNGEDLRLGLEQVSGNLSDFFNMPIENIIKQNQVLLLNKNVKLSTLAEPHSLVRPMVPAIMQIGADIAFKSQNVQNIQTTEWKFAGLKIQITIENFGDVLKINYETELTQPNNGTDGVSSIGGNKEKSSVVIPLDQAVKLFQISLRTNGDANERLPYLSALPLLGEIFKSKSRQSNYKTITGIIEVSENE